MVVGTLQSAKVSWRGHPTLEEEGGPWDTTKFTLGDYGVPPTGGPVLSPWWPTHFSLHLWVALDATGGSIRPAVLLTADAIGIEQALHGLLEVGFAKLG